jgi:hypothetical protein
MVNLGRDSGIELAKECKNHNDFGLPDETVFRRRTN